ncbi:hypothetical protein P3T76_015153 [Phytophthora citrophthora]|uniref:DUF6570 domain-containing protein n=1 Tax=Phytophthora citrophthora TaxID=4793 RepID=A0AAD9FZV7_9STRA|nr:hypothetical protein P3T76_015153 [Phytophthora citrophthora]
MVFGVEERREQHRLAVQRNRARESPEARAKRLRRQRERQQRVRTTRGGNEVHETVEESQQSWLDGGVPRLRPVSNRTQKEALYRLRLVLGPSGLDDATCAVCDCSKLRKSMHMISLGDDRDRIQQMHLLLSSVDEQLPMELAAEYDCSVLFAGLGGMLLSKRCIHPAGYIHACQECNASLTKQLLPKFSIKNEFYVGSLPNRLANTKLPERFMTQTVMVFAVMRVMRGGSHRAIRSHCLAFDSIPGPATTLLPTSVRNISCYRVVMPGPFTTEQQARVRQMHLVRRQMVEDLLAFYCEHNILYEDVTVDCSGLASEVVAEHLICEEADADVEAGDVDAESDRVGSSTEVGDAVGETDVVEHRVVFIASVETLNVLTRTGT